MRLNKWYFATNVHGLRNAFDQIQVAVTSCLKFTRLSPHCLVDDDGADDHVEERIRWLTANGVAVRRHRASMVDLLAPKFLDQMRVYGGHWLRCDIPEIETDESFVLYTDIDVMFMQDVSQVTSKPKFIACAPEHDRNDYSYFNSGVMVMNLPALRRRKAGLVDVVARRISTMAPYDDQSALNELYAGTWSRLPPIWNWKPYWGENNDALIVHFHGPKPAHATEMQGGSLTKFGDDYRILFERNPESYRFHCKIFDELLTSGRD